MATPRERPGRPDPAAPRWGHMERTLHRGEVPRTRFLDMEDAKKVTVLTWPGMEAPLYQPRIVDHTPEGKPIWAVPRVPMEYDLTTKEPAMPPLRGDAAFAATFAKTCHAPEPVDIAPHETLGDVLGAAAGGSLLWQNAETFYYGLRLEGLSRVCSHQLVRARIGWSFSETCTGDHDWRHGDFLVPRAWCQRPLLLKSKIRHMLMSKHLYAADVDGADAQYDDEHRPLPLYGINPVRRLAVEGESFTPSMVYDGPVFGSPNDARYVLHPNLKVFVHAKVNLAALKEWYAKRICPMTQSWEMVKLAERVKEAVLKVTPWAAPAFTNPCEVGECWYLKAYRQPLAMANYFRPDEVHAHFMDDWHPDEFLFPDRTHQQMSSGEPFQTREYEGYRRVR